MTQSRHTHTAAVLGLVFRDQELLLLRRSNQPMLWAPPGGRLLNDEDPIQGLQREIHEECGLTVKISMPIDTWFGRHEGVITLGIIYICRHLAGSVVLSSEHSDTRWFSKRKLNMMIRKSPDDVFGDLSLYSRAFSFARLLHKQDG